MYYEDLTPYTYSIEATSLSYSDLHKQFLGKELIETFGIEPHELILLNLGWLERDYPFPTAEINLAEVEKIASLCLSPKNGFRGFHLCHFCEAKKKAYVDSSGRTREYSVMLEQEYKSHIVPLGSGEIWIKGNSNIVYVAPTLILHYIMEHGYAMPDDARNALNEMK